MSYTVHAGATAGVVKASIDLPSRNAPKQAWFAARMPSGVIRSVTLNGKPWTKIDRAKDAIALPLDRGRLELEIRY